MQVAQKAADKTKKEDAEKAAVETKKEPDTNKVKPFAKLDFVVFLQKSFCLPFMSACQCTAHNMHGGPCSRQSDMV